ncbi:MAG: class I SAM-dependent methyltransferase [Proteobacteria bacterium]|nr:class I SAM-dependent methyltransferase [Pseudomonadota bacterium]
MSPDSVISSKTTTQHAPLERLLTWFRIRKVLPYVKSKAVVLDFGCGRHLGALRALKSIASVRIGVDSCFKNLPAEESSDGILACGSFLEVEQALQLKGARVDTILSLACFEHLEQHEFQGVLKQLDALSGIDCRLVGTVPTPWAKPVLEFLSYRLHLIDPSQIEDHKVYYDRAKIEQVLVGTTWLLTEYRLFQFAMNSFFVLKKKG